MKTKRSNHSLRVGLVVPHIFMHRDILPGVIFSPGQLALTLADELVKLGVDVTLLTPGPVETLARNVNADLSLFELELAARGDTYTDLLRKHPLTFVTLGRQVQAEIIAEAYKMANDDQLDVVHIYTNEEDLALPFAQFCKKPVVFTHHDPFNFLIKHKNIFPKYKHLNWLSISYAQRSGMPQDTNWVGNIYHGADAELFKPVAAPTRDYVAYFGRIVEQKGVHLAIAAVQEYNKTARVPLKLKIAGKHYASYAKDTYWKTQIEPQIDGTTIEYLGHLSADADKRDFLANAAVTIMPSQFDEPFGMVGIEAMACGTPVVGLANGAIAEVVRHGVSGVVEPASDNQDALTSNLAESITKSLTLDPAEVRQYFLANFTTAIMVKNHVEMYDKLS